MSLVTVQRSPDSATHSKKNSNTCDDLIKFNNKTANIKNRYSLNLGNYVSSTINNISNSNNINNNNNNISDINNTNSNTIKKSINEFNHKSTNSLSSLSFNSNLVQLNKDKKIKNLNETKRASFNLDEKPLANFNDLKALYSSSTSNSSSFNKNFNRTSINSNTIPYVNKKSKNLKNSNLINRYSLNLTDSRKLKNNSDNFDDDDDDVVTKTIKPLESNLKLNSTIKNKNRNLIEKYFVVKDAALILPKRSSSNLTRSSNENLNNNINVNKKTNEECKMDQVNTSTNSNSINSDSSLNSSLSSSTGDILIHLQSMIALLRPNDTIILAVKLFSYVQERIRYLVIIDTKSSKTSSENSCEETAILGLDLFQINNDQKEENEEKLEMKNFQCTVGLVLPIYANCEITLDGDGGFKFKSHQSTHIFKPVSIQAMWSAYQYLHKAFANARQFNFYSIQTSSGTNSPSSSSISPSFLNSNNDLSSNLTLNDEQSNMNNDWFKYYSSFISKYKSEQQSINEWYQKEERSAQREDFTTPYFDSLQLCKEQEETGLKIKEKLKEIMMNSKDDYGSMSTIHIRQILEKELQLNLDNFKRFIDATIFQFYNQLVECATQILDYLYLGTEWNASNYDSLVKDRVTHILNVSSEVDNFFPDTFKYLNIRVLDIEETDLLKEFDRTNKFIQEAKEQNTSCLVHCKMGVSRSASVVIAYLMKEFDYTYEKAFKETKQKRPCISPNDGFKQQLITYESILNAHKAKYNLFEPSPQTSSSSVLTGIQQNEQDNLKNTTDNNNNLETITNQPGSSVKETISKIQSKSSIDYLNTPNANLVPPLSPNNNRKFQNQNQNNSSPFVSRKTINLSPISNSAKNDENSRLSPSFDSDETPRIKSNKNENINLEHNISLNINDFYLKQVQSCPSQMCNNKKKLFENKKPIKDFDANQSSSNILLSENNSSANTNIYRSQVNFTLSSETLDPDSCYPVGTVKRQVESINIKSKPIEYALIRQSTIDFEKIEQEEKQEQQQQQQSQQKQATTSPDSKRFKCEFLQTVNNNANEANNCIIDNYENDENLSVLSRQNEFNKSKKMFEQLELRKDLEKEDKIKKNSSNSFKSNNRQSNLNATIS